MTKLTGQQIADEELAGWATLLMGLHTRIATGDFATGLRVVAAIGEAAEAMNHHPDLDLRYPHVDVRLSSHDVGDVTERDVALAKRITALAAEAGVSLSAAELSRWELALDTPALDGIRPFWAAVLAMDAEDVKPDEVRDPADAVPAIWFQDSGDEPGRQRWHPDVWVDPSQVQPRIDAALAAGGTLVSDEQAPAFWILADAEGNQVCLCTWQSRD